MKNIYERLIPSIKNMQNRIKKHDSVYTKSLPHSFGKFADPIQHISGHIFTSGLGDLCQLLESNSILIFDLAALETDQSYQLILQNIKRDLLRKYYKLQDYKITQEKQSHIYRSFKK